jgi:hypothetical protein
MRCDRWRNATGSCLCLVFSYVAEIFRDDVVLEGQRVSHSANDAIQRRIAFGPSRGKWRYIIQERRLPSTTLTTYCTTAPGVWCDGVAGIVSPHSSSQRWLQHLLDPRSRRIPSAVCLYAPARCPLRHLDHTPPHRCLSTAPLIASPTGQV